jgi:hypothetical protein
MAAWQHHRIATMRALETARPMLRATNTGITAVIDHRGRVVKSLPWFTTGILEADIAGRKGDTPYLRWGDWFGLGVMVLLIGVTVGVSRFYNQRPAVRNNLRNSRPGRLRNGSLTMTLPLNKRPRALGAGSFIQNNSK